MRAPWYIFIPLPIIVTCVALFLFVKDTDTVSPPSQEDVYNSVELWKTGYPISNETIEKVRADITAGDAVGAPVEITPEPVPEPEPVTPQEVVIDISGINIHENSPALDALTGKNLSTAQLIKYSEQMMLKGRAQPARIAFERIIDSAQDATTEDRAFAASYIRDLATKTPLWNPDPTTRKALEIEISLNETYKDQSEKIITMLKDTVINASDGTVIAKVKITTIKIKVAEEETQDTEEIDKPKNEPTQSSLSIGKDTSLVTFNITQDADLDTKIPAALYYAVRNRNSLVQNHITIPKRPTDISAIDALYNYITRTAWVNATNPSTADKPE